MKSVLVLFAIVALTLICASSQAAPPCCGPAMPTTCGAAGATVTVTATAIVARPRVVAKAARVALPPYPAIRKAAKAILPPYRVHRAAVEHVARPGACAPAGCK
jgi:hypothetical protein